MLTYANGITKWMKYFSSPTNHQINRIYECMFTTVDENIYSIGYMNDGGMFLAINRQIDGSIIEV